MSDSRPRAVMQTHPAGDAGEPEPLLRRILPDVDVDCVVCGHPGRYRVEPRQDGPRMVVDHPRRRFPCRVPQMIDQLSTASVD